MTSKRTILITGCSDGGLGVALALEFHRTGWRVFASARNMSKLGQVEAAGIETVQLDVTSEESIAGCVAAVRALSGGSLDALVNNAGATYNAPLMDMDVDKTRALFDLNVFAIIRVTQAFLPLLLHSAANGRAALVANTTSISSLKPLPFSGAYGASKAAAASFTEAMRLELAPFGIRTVNLMTGSVVSNGWSNAPTFALPPTSIYNVAKADIERIMSDGELSNGVDTATWAEGVVRTLNQRDPPHWVWGGQYTTQMWFASLFPIGFWDRMVKKVTGIQLLEQKIKEQGGLGKVKLL